MKEAIEVYTSISVSICMENDREERGELGKVRERRLVYRFEFKNEPLFSIKGSYSRD